MGETVDRRPPRRHVVQLLEAFGGGALDQMARIVRALPDDRFRVTILHGRRPESPADPAALFPAGTDLLAWDVGRELAPLRDLRAARTLSSLLRRLAPDLVHAHSAKAGGLGRLVSRRLGLPCLYSPHGYAFLRRDVGTSRRRLFRWIEALLARRSGALTVAGGPGEAAAARALGGPVRLIGNMVDVAAIAATPRPDRPSPQPGAPLCLVAMGRLSPQKNFPLFAAIARHRPQDRFLWIGDGPDRPAEPPANLTITGWCRHDDALRQLAGADALLQTSLWEGLPLTVLEAMALELPVLAWPAPGTVDLVTDGRTGYLCPDAESFAARLGALAADPARRAGLGAAGRAMVEAHHDVARNAALWMEVYDAMTTGR